MLQMAAMQQPGCSIAATTRLAWWHAAPMQQPANGGGAGARAAHGMALIGRQLGAPTRASRPGQRGNDARGGEDSPGEMRQQQRLAARGNYVCRIIVLSSCSFCTWNNQSSLVFGRPLLLRSHIFKSKSLFFV